MSTNVRIPAVFLIVALIGGGTAALTVEQYCEYSHLIAPVPAPYFVGGPDRLQLRRVPSAEVRS